MNREIRERHLAAADEGRWRGEQADHHQKTANGFDDAGGAWHRGERDTVAAKKAQELLESMTGEQESDDDPEQCVGGRFETLQSIHSAALPANIVGLTTMKITDAKVAVRSPARNFVTLKIYTDSGLYGVGDARHCSAISASSAGARA